MYNFVDIHIDDTNSEYYTMRGMDAEISCIVAINPHQQVNITWSKDMNNNFPLSTNTFEEDGEFLSILSLCNVRDEDKGLYSCSVNDGDTEYNETTNVVVECKGIIKLFALL